MKDVILMIQATLTTLTISIILTMTAVLVICYGGDIRNEQGEIIAQTLESYSYVHEGELFSLPVKPNIFRDPNDSYWICSKHGDLPDSWDFLTVETDTIYRRYCLDCVCVVMIDILDANITGVEK